MSELNHIVDHDHGPVVDITIGLSFNQQEDRRRRGIPTPVHQTIRAVIHTGLATTLISEQLRERLDPTQLALSYLVSFQEIAMLETMQRPQTKLSINFPELGPMFKSVEAIIVPLPGPIHCFLGRNFLHIRKAIFRYDGDYELFSLSGSWI